MYKIIEMDILIVFIISSFVIGTIYPLTIRDISVYPNASVKWEQGKIKCETEGKKLLRIENLQKWEDLLALNDSMKTHLLGSTYWIGLKTYSSDCTAYTWGGSDPTCSWTNWGAGQPEICWSNTCGKIVNGKWATASCYGESLSYICERITPGMCTGSDSVGGINGNPTKTTTPTTTTTVETTTTIVETTSTPAETTTSAAVTTTTTQAETTSATEKTTTQAETTSTTAETTTSAAETTTTQAETTSATETTTTQAETTSTTTETTTSAVETITTTTVETTTGAGQLVIGGDGVVTTTGDGVGGVDTTTIQQSTGSSVDGSIVSTAMYQSLVYSVTDGIATATTSPDNNPIRLPTTASQAGIVGFTEHQGNSIVDTNLVSSVANPIALTITGNVDSCKQTCLDTEMNSFQCWAVTITSSTSNECILYYIDEPTKLRAPSVLVTATGSVVFLKIQATVLILGTACSCKLDFNWDPPGNVSEQYTLDLLEKIHQLKDKLLIKKNETQKYQRTLISAEDKRASAVGIGSMGIALLVVIFGFVVVADITHFITLFKFLKRSCQKKHEETQP